MPRYGVKPLLLLVDPTTEKSLQLIDVLISNNAKLDEQHEIDELRSGGLFYALKFYLHFNEKDMCILSSMLNMNTYCFFLNKSDIYFCTLEILKIRF